MLLLATLLGAPSLAAQSAGSGEDVGSAGDVGSGEAAAGALGAPIQVDGSLSIRLQQVNFTASPFQTIGLNTSACGAEFNGIDPAVWLLLELQLYSPFALSTCDISSSLDTELLVTAA